MKWLLDLDLTDKKYHFLDEFCGLAFCKPLAGCRARICVCAFQSLAYRHFLTLNARNPFGDRHAFDATSAGILKKSPGNKLKFKKYFVGLGCESWSEVLTAILRGPVLC